LSESGSPANHLSQRRSVCAILLAAGRGRRLGLDIPKPLARIAPGRTLLSDTLGALDRLGIKGVVIVAGHRADMLRRAAPGRRFVINDCFAESDTARSAAIGLSAAPPKADVLLLNADLFVDAASLRGLLEDEDGSSRLLLGLDPPDAEQVRVEIDGQGRVRRIGKSLPVPGAGESLGAIFLRAQDRPALLKAVQAAHPADLLEAPIQSAIDAGSLSLGVMSAAGGLCMEVDTPEDLRRLRARLRSASK